MANPALSVIIPMYNAEENIGECLDSLFAQTFQDFEVIVVDDCSTDNSVKIVESYAPKFNGRLHITHTEKNSGNSAIPSNLALEIAQGEYVIFVDSNDFLLATALETFYTAAEEYEADVVYTSAFYDIRQPNDVYLLRDGAGKKMLEDGRIDKPVLTIDNPDKNLRLLLTKEREGNFCYTWTKFIRRDFLLENEITFPVISNGADFIWNINVYCHAKKFLRIPMPLYFYRRYKTQSQVQRELREQVLYGISEFITWTKLLDELESKNKILSDNPAYCLAAMKSHFERLLSRMDEARDQLSAKEFYGILFNKLIAEKNLSDETVSSLLSLINVDNLANRGVRQVLEDAIQADPKFLNKFTARVDVKFISRQKGKGDFQILNVSDVKATVDKPSWLQRGGIGYQIQSHVGKLEFVAKADTDGQIKVNLKVKDIREPGDKNKRIPCWIGYTSLIVNGNKAFDTVTLAWHDKPYVYNVEAKAGEEVKIQIEWLLPKEILKNVSTDLAEPLPFPKLTDPAISVIIPMYNAAEYVGECLDSLLLQTFRNFEVIVVDDCSTDDSVKIVEGYTPKFEGRLQITQTETNSGGGGYIPRNIGIKLAKGEYICLLDADDFILLTALETLYNAAKEYDAEVVYTSARYLLHQPNQIVTSIDGEGKILVKSGLKDEPALRINEQKENLRRLFFEGNYHAGWTKFVRRSFLLENQIVFPEIIRGGDYIWGIHVYCCAKRFLRLTVPLYIYRDYGVKSVTKIKRTPSEQISLWVSAFAVWAKTFSELSNKIEVLKDNPTYRYAVMEQEFMWFFRHTSQEMKGFCLTEIYQILCNELAKKNDMFDSTVPFLFSIITAYKKCLLGFKPYIAAIEEEYKVKSSPAISVIISLFNYGKYVSECLDSLLAQTFTDFEVIVVDDCSTDNSVEVVEKYISKFDGRLKFTKTEKNTGGGGTPRNIGFRLSSGKYVFFMDADDVVTETALDEMYSNAEKFDADVVYCEKYFMSSGRGQDFHDNLHLADSKIQSSPFVKKPTLETQDMDVRIQRALKFNYWVTPWLRLVRRELLIENDILFPVFTQSEDVVWTFKVLFCAKRFLRIPNPCYIRRMHNDSVSSKKRTSSEQLHNWMDRTIHSLKDMDNFMKRIEFFREHPEQRFFILESFVKSDFNSVSKRCGDLTMYQVYEAVRRNFGECLGEYDILVSCLCAELKHHFAKNLSRNITKNFEPYLTARIDLQFASKDDFQILSVSDDKATVDKPAWLQRCGGGYKIESYAGSLELVTKATANGQIRLNLKGVDVRKPEDNSKRIPYWIDYTNLTINGNMIFDTLTPAWHDKPYVYDMNVKADEEIKIEVEWLPHRSDT